MKENIAIFFKKEPYTQEDFEVLGKITEKYPYFHRAQIAYLKALKEKNNPNYNDFLKKVAAATQQRILLFEYVKNLEKNTHQKNISEAPFKKHKTQNDLIDKFISENPRISKIIQTEPLESLQEKEENHFDPSSLMTETLAKMYVAQKKYDKAIEAYKILSLKYPEKNLFFAEKMKKIKNLKLK